MATQTGLDFLRTRTVVDCDTLDEEGMYEPDHHDQDDLLIRNDSCENSWSVSRLHIEPGEFTHNYGCYV